MSEDGIEITNVKFEHFEPEIKVESDEEIGTPLSVIYESMSNEEPDDNGRFAKSKKEKGVSMKKSKSKSKNNN